MLQAKMNNWSGWITETRPDILNGIYKKLLIESGFNVISEQYHFFEPFGFTALYLLGESHFAIHTFPEESKTYLELTSCVEKPFYSFINAIKGGATNEQIQQ